MKSRSLLVCCAASLLFIACGGGDDDDDGSSFETGGAGAGGSGSGATSGTGSGSGSGGIVIETGGAPSSGGNGTGATCAAQSAQAELRPVYLAFAFDVSGSMGKLDYPYHDPELKWQPVVAATKAFFADPDSAALSASLTFFPTESDKCDSASYSAPDVPMTALPSTEFADAIDAITPASADDWIGGTPTLAVVEGTLSFLRPLVEADPSSVYALVLVTDGYPQSCDDNSIESVALAVDAVKETIPTYVIGVENPPLEDAPDTVSDLNAIAVAGGTEQAFIIQTGDPEQTKTDFKAVIDGIRGRSVSCELEIPPPPAGETFDPQKVNVTYTSGEAEQGFAYDQTCELENTWRYDDESAPSAIVLCPSTCEAVKSDPSAQLNVEFGCETRIAIVR